MYSIYNSWSSWGEVSKGKHIHKLTMVPNSHVRCADIQAKRQLKTSTLPYTNHILVLRTLDDVEQFNRIYGCHCSKDKFSFIQWKRVASSFVTTTPSKVKYPNMSIYGITCGTAVWTAVVDVCGMRPLVRSIQYRKASLMEALEELGEQLRSYETSSWEDARCKVRAEREAAGKPHIAQLADDDEFCQQVIKKKEELTKVIFQA